MARLMVIARDTAAVEVEDAATLVFLDTRTGERCRTEIIAMEENETGVTLLVSACGRTLRISI